MNNKRITKRASGLCLAMMAGLFVLCTNTLSFAQTIDQQANCFTLGIAPAGACGGSCTQGGDCDHCATFTFTNISSNCDITSLVISSVPGPGGILPSTCFSTCSAQGPALPAGCNDQPKVYLGSYPPAGNNGVSNTVTICHAGAGTRYFKFSIGGTNFNPGAADCCSGGTSEAIVHF